jgi:hypothetical protein
MNYYRSKNGYYYKRTENGNVRVSIDDYNNYMNGGGIFNFINKKISNKKEIFIGDEFKDKFKAYFKYKNNELHNAYIRQIQYDTIINNIHNNMFAQEIIKIAELLYDEINNNKSNNNNNQSNNNKFRNTLTYNGINNKEDYDNYYSNRIKKLNIIKKVIEKRKNNINAKIDGSKTDDSMEFTTKKQFNYPKIKEVLELSIEKINIYNNYKAKQYEKFIFDSIFSDLNLYTRRHSKHKDEMYSILYLKQNNIYN